MASIHSRPIPLSKNIKGRVNKNFIRIEKLLDEYKPVDLCWGMANYRSAVPSILRNALIATQSEDVSFKVDQYGRSRGHPELVTELAEIYSKLMGRTINPMDEVLVTVGANKSLYSIFKAILNPNDEVIIIEPFYTSFKLFVTSCGGVPRYVKLHRRADTQSANDLVFDEDELRQAFNEKTRAIVVNTPHNPTGKVFNLKEMTVIAELCKQYNCLYISDEVYEWLRYDGERKSITSLPGMWERSVTIGSAGKTFNVTGWKVGWTIGPAYLISAAYEIHFSTIHCVANPLQVAIAHALRHEKNLIGTDKSYWYELRETTKMKRDRIYKVLSDAGLDPLLPNGGYFMLIDISKLKFDSESEIQEHDRQICEWLLIEKGLATVPASAYFSDDNKCDKYLRICFFRSDETIKNAEDRIKLICNYNEEKTISKEV